MPPAFLPKGPSSPNQPPPAVLKAVWRALALLAITLSPPTTSAQVRSSPGAFETLDLGLTILTDIGDGALHRWWSPGPAVGAGLTMPFYLGSVEAGLQYAHPTALREDVAGFRSLFAYAGWGGGHNLGYGFAARAGLRVGVMAMRVDGDTISQFRRRESELGVVTRVALRWMPGRTWFTEASLSYQSVLTHPRMEQVFLSAGLGRRFATPAWLRDFLD
jgi:hypothetical protein